MSFRGCLALVVVLVVAVVGGFLGYNLMCSWIPAGEVGVMYSGQSGLDNKVILPCRIWVPPYHQLYTYPTKLQAAIYTQSPTDGEAEGADGIQVTTSDNAVTIFDIVAWYHVKPEDVPLVFKSFGTISIEDIQRLHIRRAARAAAQSVGTSMDIFHLMGEGRRDANEKLTREMQKELGYKGITVDCALFCQAYPQQGLTSKITQRVNSITDLTIAEIHRQTADLDRQITQVRADADAKSALIRSAKTVQRSLEMLTLETDLEAVRQWNGHLPAFPKGAPYMLPPGAIDQATAQRPVQRPQPDPTTGEGQ